MSSSKRVTAALIGLLVLVAGGWLVRDLTSGGTPKNTDRTSHQQPVNTKGSLGEGLSVRPLSGLPPETAATWKLIQKNGPFPSRQDGVIFENREKRLPRRASDYYHEYTVATPGSSDRGARRLITGQGRELYYTEDHYASFVFVDPGK